MTTRLKEHNCPECNHLLDAATALGGEDIEPKHEDLTVCIECGEVLQFDEEITPVRIDDEVFVMLPAETICQVLFAQQQIRKRITH